MPTDISGAAAINVVAGAAVVRAADMTDAGRAPLLVGLCHSVTDVTRCTTGMCTCTSGRSTVQTAGSSSLLLLQQV